MSAVRKKAAPVAPAARTKNGGSLYVRKGRGRAAEPRQTSRDRALSAREERLGERGLLPKDRQASYAAARPSTFRRTRSDLGGEADAHVRNEAEFWRMREISRSMDRDDAVPGPVVESWLDVVLGGAGVQMDPQTGAGDLDRAIKEDMGAWSSSPSACDVAGRFPLPMIGRLTLRHSAFDGDALVIFHREGDQAGKVQLLEGDRLAGSDGPNGKVLNGVEVDHETGAVVAYWVLKRRPESRKRTGYTAPRLNERNYIRIPARDKQDRLNATLVLNPKRVTEYRGVTKWHRVFDALGMSDDAFFATVAAIQAKSCIPMAITTTGDVKFGKREENGDDEDQDDNVTAPPEEEFTPNTLLRLRPGEGLAGAPNAGPSPDEDKFLRKLYRLVAMQVDLPYVLAFRDTSDTVFHGYRGELEQAKRAAEWTHAYFTAQFCQPVYDFRLDFTLARLRQDHALAKLIDEAETRGTLRKARAQAPKWPYVDPKTDREADALGIDKALESPRAVHASRGRDLDDVRSERHEDIAAERRDAKDKAKAEGEPDEWRAYCAPWALGLPLPGSPAAATPPAATPKADAGAPVATTPDGTSVDTVQDTALNGAQVQALQSLVQSVTDGMLPAAAAKEVILASFPTIKPDAIDRMLGAAEAFEPATPEPAPAAAPTTGPPAEEGADADA